MIRKRLQLCVILLFIELVFTTACQTLQTPTPLSRTPSEAVATVHVVVVTQKIPKGGVFGDELLTLVPIPEDVFVPEMISSFDDVVGKKAKFDLEPGTILTTNVLYSETVAVIAARPIKSGSVITAADLSSVMISGDALHSRMFTDIEMVVNHTANTNIAEGAYLVADMLLGYPLATPTALSGTGTEPSPSTSIMGYIVTFILGFASSMQLMWWLTRRGSPMQTISVAMTTRAIPQGALVTKENISFIKIPRDRSIPSMVTKTEQVVGLTSRFALDAGVVLSQEMLVAEETTNQ